MTKLNLGNSPSGLFTATYYIRSGALVFRSPIAVMWKHVTHEECIGCFCEIAENFADAATVADLLWLAKTIASYEQIALKAEHH